VTLSGKRIVVGVGGGIAAYKAVVLVRELQRRGAEVRVVMTEAATRFVGAVTFTGITGKPAVADLWDPSYAGEVHVELGAWADAVVVAPATQNLLARAAHGFADDAVLATLSAARGALVFAPAMHTRMWDLPRTRRNVATLVGDGAVVVGPETGPLASGEVGEGRMSEPDAIADAVEQALASQAGARPARDLAGRRILVTAGPTIEDLDPVRFLGNRSTGRMGYALAARAALRGADVVLVSGPVSLAPPAGVTVEAVRSARDMQAAVMARFADADAIVMAAAVADYRPKDLAPEKIKKGEGPMTLELVRNPDILAELGARREKAARPVLVGFAVESTDLVTHARAKLVKKGCDLVVGNLASVGFGGDENEVVLVDREGESPLPRASKGAIADRILDRIRDLLGPSAPAR
jgi:phosphopantothenoylcysteine decarboxylase/phosphopantothenate--cysteine ligase